MSEPEKKIKMLKDQIAEREVSMRQELINLGKNLYKDVIINESSDIAAMKSQALELEKQIPELNTQKQNIYKKINRLERIDELLEKNRLESKSLQEQVRTFYIEIGKAAFTNFKDATISKEDTQSIFETLLKNESKLREIDNNIYQMSNIEDDKNFLGELVQKGKNSLLISRRKSITSNMHNLYREAGENFCKTPIFGQMAENELADLAVPYRENIDKGEKLETEEKNLLNEKKTIREELKGLCEGKHPKKKIAEIEALMQEKSNSYAEGMHFFGDYYYSSQKEIPKTHPFTSFLKKLDTLYADNRKDTLEVETLEAAIEVEKNLKIIERKTRKVGSLENEILKRKEEIKVLKKEISQIEADNKKKKEFIEKQSTGEKTV